MLEVLLAAILGLVLLTAVYSLHLVTEQSFQVGESSIELMGGANQALEIFERDIRAADQLVNSRTIDAESYATGTEQLILELPSIDSSGNIINGTHDYIVYFRDPLKLSGLIRKIDANIASSRTSGERLILNNIDTFAFQSEGTNLSDVSNLNTVNNIEVACGLKKWLWQSRGVDWNANYKIRMRNQ